MIRKKHDIVRRISVIGLLTALTAVLSMIKIPILGVSVTLVLPVVVIGAALFGPWVGAWLTVIPNIIAFGEAGIFLAESPVGCVITLLLKGILAGIAAGLVYKYLHDKSYIRAVTLSALVAPIVNSGVFLLGCYIFIWDKLIAVAAEAGYGIGMLVFGMVGINFVIEIIFNTVLCPTILRLIKMASKKIKEK